MMKLDKKLSKNNSLNVELEFLKIYLKLLQKHFRNSSKKWTLVGELLLLLLNNIEHLKIRKRKLIACLEMRFSSLKPIMVNCFYIS